MPVTKNVDTARMSAERLSRLVYISTAVRPFARDDLRALVRDAARRNRARGLTGVLCYFAGDFLQIIEGPSENVSLLWNRVCCDPRHTWVQLLINEPVNKRLFGSWHMGLCEMRSEHGVARSEFRAIAGFLSRCRGLDADIVAMGLLEHFRSLSGTEPEAA